MKRKFIILTLLILATVPSNIFAAEISGVRFSETYHDQGIILKLRGTGLKTAFFFRAFAAGYYSSGQSDAYELGRFPKRIEVEYFVSIPGKKLNDYTIERMKANVDESEFNRIGNKIKLMESLFVDLKSGDRFSLTYIPGVGTKFAHNGRLTGMIEGDDFAKALFSVWLGDKPFDRDLKNQICGYKKDLTKRRRSDV